MNGIEARLVGREAELAAVRRFLGGSAPGGPVLVVTGEAGTGKTALLGELERIALSAGMRTLSAIGRESEAELAFAGLHQLLGPELLFASSELPGHLTDALHAAFGTGPDPAPYDALLVGHAVLATLVDLAGPWPLLVLVDDAQWWDRESLDVLAFTARRLPAESVSLVVASRGTVPPTPFGEGFLGLNVEPLTAGGADALPRCAATAAARKGARAGAGPGPWQPPRAH